MSTFLSWLWSKAILAYNWFGEQFWDYINIIRNTWTWIVQKAYEVYSNAISWSLARINELRSYVISLSDILNDRINHLRNNIPVLVQQVINTIIANISNTIDYLKQRINKINLWIDNAFGFVYNIVQTNIDSIRVIIIEWISTNFGWILNIKTRLIAITTALSNTDIVNLKDLITKYYIELKQFASDPLGYILDILWSKVLYYMEWVLGLGLGTTKYDLPPKPAWRQK